MVVHRVLSHHAVEVLSGFLSLEQGELQVIEHDPLFVKGQDFKLLRAEVYRIAQMVLIMGRRFRLLFLFGWCNRKDFSVFSALGGFFALFFLLFQPSGV